MKIGELPYRGKRRKPTRIDKLRLLHRRFYFPRMFQI